MIIVDVNLLLYATMDAYTQHTRAKEWWEGALSGDEQVALTVPAVFGFTRLGTSSRLYTDPLTVTEAVDYVREWLKRSPVTLLHPGPRHLDHAFGLLEQVGTGGNLTTDAQLAALAIENQATVYSNDSDFGKFPGLRWVNPLA